MNFNNEIVFEIDFYAKSDDTFSQLFINNLRFAAKNAAQRVITIKADWKDKMNSPGERRQKPKTSRAKKKLKKTDIAVKNYKMFS